jgi:hypothetical protein
MRPKRKPQPLIGEAKNRLRRSEPGDGVRAKLPEAVGKTRRKFVRGDDRLAELGGRW